MLFPTFSMPASATTKDHDTIKKWVEERGGKPATVKRTLKPGGKPGVLRLMFDDSDTDTLVEISWDDFFQVFDENNLMLLYQEKTAQGTLSRFFKFVRPR